MQLPLEFDSRCLSTCDLFKGFLGEQKFELPVLLVDEPQARTTGGLKETRHQLSTAAKLSE
jgi:hypothetical protein